MSTRARALLARWAPELGAASFGIFWFYWLGYGPTLDPRNVEWMFRGDWSTYLLGFLFSRNAEWTWPLGFIPDWPHPEGTTTGFTDANPWASALFRLLSPVLPEDFQFAGLWFLLTFVLQGAIGAKIAGLYTDDPVRRALGGALFVLTPIVPHRAMHVALSGAFLVTGALYLALRGASSRADALRASALGLGLVVWAAGTHGYLSAMTLALVTSSFVRFSLRPRLLRPYEGAAFVVVGVFLTLATYAAFGLIGWREMELGAEGFGEFSADLLALVNPMGWSRFVEPFPYARRQYEGFAYLGAGVIALLLASSFFRTRARPMRGSRAPLILAVLAMTTYALSSRVTFAGRELFEVEALYAPLGELTSIFRSSGRFLWPLHLALVAIAVSRAALARSRAVGVVALGIAVVLQVVELDREVMSGFEPAQVARLTHPAWSSLGTTHEHLSLHPLRRKWICPGYDEDVVTGLAYEAYRRGVTFDGGNVMRSPPGAEERCGRPMTKDRLDAGTIYVLGRTPRARHELRWAGARCGILDGLHVCVSPDRPSPLLEEIDAQRGSRSGGGS